MLRCFIRQNDIWLALPYPQGQRSREIKMRLQKLSPDGETGGDSWEDIETQETTIQGQVLRDKHTNRLMQEYTDRGI